MRPSLSLCNCGNEHSRPASFHLDSCPYCVAMEAYESAGDDESKDARAERRAHEREAAKAEDGGYEDRDPPAGPGLKGDLGEWT